MPVVPMTLISGLSMVVVSLVTKAPSKVAVARYFPQKSRRSTSGS
jgi:hypothetical protein